jgi:hypothetical protein
MKNSLNSMSLMPHIAYNSYFKILAFNMGGAIVTRK